jgi:hypothetical protein
VLQNIKLLLKSPRLLEEMEEHLQLQKNLQKRKVKMMMMKKQNYKVHSVML